ncbi:acylneuraminate cytidylyltransferase family protein [Pelagibacterales bacterium SAG-MED50]|nr:acylneuraminate cytidylyltransferase family protein [Pelagibacterales bacterium SAG-MED50]
MYKQKKILAIIPARGGSKGIKNKNLKKIKEKSLLNILSNVLKKIKIIDDTVISTDSFKIIKDAKKNNIENFILRSKKLSGDRVDDMPVLKDALQKYEEISNKKFDYIVMLQLTSPLRNYVDVEKAIKKIIDRNFNALWTISEIDLKYHPDKQLIKKGEFLKYFSKNAKKIIARQQLNKTYYRNGVAYIFKKNIVERLQKLPQNTGTYIVNSHQISIDSLEDLKKAEKLI